MRLFYLLCALITIAARPIYDFSDQVLRDRFEQNLAKYRCLVCQNESLLDSQAPLAVDLRDEIYKHIKAGKSDQEINNFLVTSYGKFIELMPEFSSHTSFLWLLPIIALACWLYLYA